MFGGVLCMYWTNHFKMERRSQNGSPVPIVLSTLVYLLGAHASTVPLALNTSTGSITPQFHVVFDDWFATVTSGSEEAPDFSSVEWQKMFGDSRYQYMLNPEGEATNTTDTSDEAEHNANRQRDDIISSDLQDQAQPPQPLPVPMPATSPMPVPTTIQFIPRDNQHQQAVSSNPPMLQHQPKPSAPPLPIPPTVSSDNPPAIPIQRKEVSVSISLIPSNPSFFTSDQTFSSIHLHS